jgi:hypothetical protein
MDVAMKSLAALVDDQVGEVTAAATFYMAEVYYDFNRSLLESERPKEMQAAQLQEYELALEENAFPFEEKAIGVHEKNLELIRAGVYNDWIEKSLAKLALLMPARYAKAEVSSGFLGSIDRYAYRAPSAAPNGVSAPQADAPADIAATGAPGGASPPDASQSSSSQPAPAVAAGVANVVAR